jgi:hypothetical protein
MQAIASATAVRPQFAGAKKSFAAKKVRDVTRASRRENGIATVPCYFARDGKIPRRASPRVTPRRLTDAPSPISRSRSAGCRRQARCARQGGLVPRLPREHGAFRDDACVLTSAFRPLVKL